jgi:hypothetical protein
LKADLPALDKVAARSGSSKTGVKMEVCMYVKVMY